MTQQGLLFEESPAAGRLTFWPPDLTGLDPAWAGLVRDFLASVAGQRLSARLTERLAAGAVVYPPEPLRALTLTPLSQVRVVILGQDPYHGPGQAEGLSFSVPDGVRLPPSLRNIFKELNQSLGLPLPAQGSLVRWARQGVLLLNACLTVEEGQAASHAGWGWELLTDALIQAVAQSPQPVVFMLWGAHAQAKKNLIDVVSGEARHLVLQANHPSPLSAMRPPVPFLGCQHFVLANEFLVRQGKKTIDW
ncbi:MAG: uracil-DNA glycosylase [Limnohabitans sp.]